MDQLNELMFYNKKLIVLKHALKEAEEQGIPCRYEWCHHKTVIKENDKERIVESKWPVIHIGDYHCHIQTKNFREVKEKIEICI